MQLNPTTSQNSMALFTYRPTPRAKIESANTSNNTHSQLGIVWLIAFLLVLVTIGRLAFVFCLSWRYFRILGVFGDSIFEESLALMSLINCSHSSGVIFESRDGIQWIGSLFEGSLQCP